MLAKYTIAGLAASALLASVAFAQSPTATTDSDKMAPAAASDTSSSYQGNLACIEGGRAECLQRRQ